MAGAHRSAHQPLTRIGDARHAGVGDDDDGLSGVEHIEHGAGRRGLGVVVDDEQPRLGHPCVLEQPSGAPGVFARDDVGRCQRVDGAR